MTLTSNVGAFDDASENEHDKGTEMPAGISSDLNHESGEKKGGDITNQVYPSAPGALCETPGTGSPPCNSKNVSGGVKRTLDLTNLGETVSAPSPASVTMPRTRQEEQMISFDTRSLPSGLPRLFGPRMRAKIARLSALR